MSEGQLTISGGNRYGQGVATWESVCPLRFVMRDGKRILQHPQRCLETREVVWQDVPLVEEV
jgi:hypothetical protein